MSTPLYPVDGHAALSGKFAGLRNIPDGATGDEQRLELNLLAEHMLGLREPAFEDLVAERITRLIVRQINFWLEQSIEPAVLKSVVASVGGQTSTTAYRDRWLDPGVVQGIERELGRKQVRLTPRPRGTA